MFISEKGVRFTAVSVGILQRYADALRKGGAEYLSCSVSFDEDGKLLVAFGASSRPDPLAIRDKVGDLEFEWYALPEALEAIKRYCVHKTFELIPLATMGIHDA